jgi:hypothetical protein
MSEHTTQPHETAEVVRTPVVPPESGVEMRDTDRSPTKTERDLNIEVIAQTHEETSQATEMVRQRVVPEEELL